MKTLYKEKKTFEKIMNSEIMPKRTSTKYEIGDIMKITEIVINNKKKKTTGRHLIIRIKEIVETELFLDVSEETNIKRCSDFEQAFRHNWYNACDKIKTKTLEQKRMKNQIEFCKSCVWTRFYSENKVYCPFSKCIKGE